MAKKKVEIYEIMKKNFVIPLFSSGNEEEATNVISSVERGGCRIIEMTHRAVNSYQIFEKVRRRFSDKELVIGAGSIVDIATAAMYINAGADFIVSPTLYPEIAIFCNRRNILYVPGCGTLTEILRSYEEGALVVKLFPANTVGGPKFLKAIKAPCPWIEAIPTGGVEPTEESLGAWIAAGAFAVGIGSKLLTKDLIKEKEWEKITAKVQTTLELIRKLKKEQISNRQ